jgi:osmotically-inducible protein OsmY/ribosomal protein L40E
MINCEKCNTQLLDTAKFCSKCGAPTQHKKPIASEEPNQNLCPKCGTENPSGAKFCKKDGFRLADAEMTLPTPSIALEDSSPLPMLRTDTLPETAPISSCIPPKQDSVKLTESSDDNTAFDARFNRVESHESDADQLQNERTEKSEETVAATPRIDMVRRDSVDGKSRYLINRSLILPSVIVLFVVIVVLSGWYFFNRQSPVAQQPPQGIESIAKSQNQSAPKEQAKPPIDPKHTEPAHPVKSPGSTKKNATELEMRINSELKEKGVGTISIKIDPDMKGIARGQVNDEATKARGLEIVATYKQLKKVDDRIHVKPQETKVDPAKIEGELNRAFRSAGIGSVTAEVDDTMMATLKGTVQSKQDQEKALSIAKSFRVLQSYKNIIFVIAPQ